MGSCTQNTFLLTKEKQYTAISSYLPSQYSTFSAERIAALLFPTVTRAGKPLVAAEVQL